MLTDNIEIPLEYFSCTSGDTELIVNENHISLSENGQSWMGLSLTTKWQANEFIFELSEANGICITTGLGLGVVQTLLLKNPKVTKVVVYEKNKNVINIFHQLVSKNKFDISKLEIIHFNADNIQNVSCDCMFLDHFEQEPNNEIVDRVKNISEKNTCNLLWYWPGVKHFTTFCVSSSLPLNNSSFQIWKNLTGIKNLPNELTDLQLNYITKVRTVYIDLFKGYQKTETENHRNNLLKLFGSKK